VSELWRLSATELAQLVRTRKASAREAADSALQRLETVNPKINAVVDHRPEQVRAATARVREDFSRNSLMASSLLAGSRTQRIDAT